MTNGKNITFSFIHDEVITFSPEGHIPEINISQTEFIVFPPIIVNNMMAIS
ncbi:Hypothetical protein c3571 [Escherichia coli CFT073]|uniref:Uncharacterized protein n=1 Tax=Escherichia coli O6:H1 (strain CFT073 / ATCC 700928 / UPEC) TaxID=199310 RepID=A0A0H2VAF5_ECOL6|nr:Hypothetical protein c3571 [Escherichia coli CFT073]